MFTMEEAWAGEERALFRPTMFLLSCGSFRDGMIVIVSFLHLVCESSSGCYVGGVPLRTRWEGGRKEVMGGFDRGTGCTKWRCWGRGRAGRITRLFCVFIFFDSASLARFSLHCRQSFPFLLAFVGIVTFCLFILKRFSFPIFAYLSATFWTTSIIFLEVE